MKRLFLMCSALILYASAFTQALSPVAIAAAGKSLTGANITLEYTLGEIATSSLSTGSDFLSQGFNQPYIVITILEQFQENYPIAVYPNPIEQFVTVEIENDEFVELRVFDVLGQQVFDPVLFSQKMTLDLQPLANGPYLMRIQRLGGEQLKTFTLFKRSTF